MAFLPKDAGRACIRRSRRYLALAESNLPDSKIKNDLRRSALVMAVAAIDSYMHWMVTRRLSEVRKTGDMPKSLKKMPVPFSDLASLADATIAARRNEKNSRPWVKVKKTVQNELLRETFQSYEQVGDAFARSGIKKGWHSVADELGEKSELIGERLNHLVHRRNQIVHEGDITRASRPQKLKYNKVNHADIVVAVDWVESLLKAIEKVVNQARTQDKQPPRPNR